MLASKRSGEGQLMAGHAHAYFTYSHADCDHEPDGRPDDLAVAGVLVSVSVQQMH